MLKELKKLKIRPKQYKKVFVGLSGGVDSSVAAYLLKKGDFDVVGVHLRCWNINGCSMEDAEDARRVAERLNIPFYVLDMEKEYKKKIVDYMVSGYARGITPNPDVMCNKEIKFGLFLKKALEMGADYIATGHYVRLEFRIQNLGYRDKNKKILNPKSYILYSAHDSAKDQSYFLWTLTQEQLRHCLFPIGDYLKSEIRVIAKKAGLPTADKKDSQGLCFVGKITLKGFLGEHLPVKKGIVVDTAGNVLGKHEGVQFYTIGQRHGFRLMKPELGPIGDTKPYYIVDKNVNNNTLTIGEGKDNQALYRKEILLEDVSFISPLINNSKSIIQVMARVRYRQPLAKAILMKLKVSTKDGFVSDGKSYKLIFDESQKFIAPGQSAVFYSKDNRMLGGGIIR